MTPLKLLSLSIVALVSVGCASLDPTSHYFRPGDGLTYKYGSFCGPGVPARVSEDPTAQLAQLARFQAVDSVDAVCRLHDICFEQAGRDQPACDYALIGAFRYYVSRTFADSEGALPSRANQRCANLVGEIMTPFSSKYVSGEAIKQRSYQEKTPAEIQAIEAAEAAAAADRVQAMFGDQQAQFRVDQRNAADAAVTDASEFGMAATIMTGAATFTSRLMTGFPETPGSCRAVTPTALQANFRCHYDHFESQMRRTRGDVNSVSLAEMPENGCADRTTAQFYPGAG